MKRRHFFVIAVIGVCLFSIFIVGVGASDHFNIYKVMGEYYNEARAQDDASITVYNESLPVAEFHGEKIYQADIEYYNNVNNLSHTGVANTQTTQETLTEVLQNMILYDEAERLGYSATQSEIESMVENTKLAYSMPEGKEIIDQFCQGANITVEQYFECVEDQAPRVIARQKLLNAVGMEFCEENGLTFTKVNPPEEMLEAREAYIAELFAQAEDEIIYYTDTN